jgi:predicted Fe-Mo cluster-binding NifX family protein
MACWKWFDGVLKEAGVKVTDKNKGRIDEVIHRYIGEQSSYGRCSADWRKARKEILENKEMKQELLGKLRSLV